MAEEETSREVEIRRLHMEKEQLHAAIEGLEQQSRMKDDRIEELQRALSEKLTQEILTREQRIATLANENAQLRKMTAVAMADVREREDRINEMNREIAARSEPATA